MRLLIECTYVYDHPYFNSGIQRVVRNVIQSLDRLSTPVECIPVILRNGDTYRVLELQPKHKDRVLSTLTRVEGVLRNYWHCHAILEKKRPFSKSKTLRRILFVLAKLFWVIFRIPMQKTQENIGKYIDKGRTQKIDYQKNDVLILLDSSWHSDAFSTVEKLKGQGIKIVSVIYDLIPVTHPQFCDEGLVAVFNKWFDWISLTADGFIAISSTISTQLKEHISARHGQQVVQSRWYDFFHLGTELDFVEKEAKISHRLQNTFSGSRNIYLMVSTIEPRKNHAYLLDAFELLWARGSDAELCIVGRIGWKCTDLIERIKNHAEFGKHLHMFNNLSDSELEYCYEHAKALVLPSHVEGFGLPIVEAMQRGLPAMASDIPIFREVGNDFVAYFDLHDPASLAQLVATFEQTGQFPARRNIDEWRWIDWNEAANMLISKILAHVEHMPSPTDLPGNPVTRANCST